MNTSEIVLGKATPSGPSGFQRFPMSLYGRDGNVQTVQNEDQEKVLKDRGYTETLPVKGSAQVEIIQQPRNGAEMVAMNEMRTKFDEAYAKLHTEYVETSSELEVVKAANADLQVSLEAAQDQLATATKQRDALLEQLAQNQKPKAEAPPPVPATQASGGGRNRGGQSATAVAEPPEKE